MSQQKKVRELYYITHISNVPSILKLGILSHERMEDEHVEYTPIYDKEIVTSRREKKTPNGKSLWSFANLYFHARNPMLYRVICEKSTDDIVLLGVRPDIMTGADIFITTGNAASPLSEILPGSHLPKIIPQIKAASMREWWDSADGSKRKIMAECLVPEVVPPEYIKSIYVANYKALEKAKEMSSRASLEIIREPYMFFQPFMKIELPNTHLSIVEGDMFFSRMQTLTISVNTVRIMGKGLASRAKYQFPDTYVYYQDLCRNRTLRMGKPCLHKRESSLDYQLADEPSTLSNANGETWLLLFPTKRHWREDADIHGIEQGLQWLSNNYKKEGIKSLALPALGCGLGRLDWKEVGPLMCGYLTALDIPVQIYLPTEREVPEKFLTKDFLLSQSKL